MPRVPELQPYQWPDVAQIEQNALANTMSAQKLADYPEDRNALMEDRAQKRELQAAQIKKVLAEVDEMASKAKEGEDVEVPFIWDGEQYLVSGKSERVRAVTQAGLKWPDQVDKNFLSWAATTHLVKIKPGRAERAEKIPAENPNQWLATMEDENATEEERTVAARKYQKYQDDAVARMKASGLGRAEAWGGIKTADVFDTKKMTRRVININELNRAEEQEPDRYLSGAAAERAMNKQALMSDITGRIDDVVKALGPMPEFTAEQAAQLSIAMRGPNPQSALSTVFRTEVGKTLNAQQQHYAINLVQLVENMLAMRTLLGAGQSSDMLRAAIEATIPNPTTPTKAYALEQLKEAKRTALRLSRGIINVPLKEVPGIDEEAPPAPEAAPAAAPTGKTVIRYDAQGNRIK